MMRRVNIRWRLTLWFCAAMTALLLVRSFWIYFMMERQLAIVADAELDLALDSLADDIRAAPDRESLRQALERYALDHRDLKIEVLSAEQGIVFQGPTERLTPAVKSRKRIESTGNRRYATQMANDGGEFRVVTEKVRSSLGELVVEVNRSTQAEQNDAWDFVIILLTTGPMVILAALGVGYLVSSRALTPVDTMISAAKEITAKRLDKRIDVPDTGDELARLAQTLNEMIDRLYKSFEEMRRFTADAAHDLRTPVAALRTEVEVSLMADRTVDDYRHSMQTVLDEAIQLSRMTAQLLDLSREDHDVNTTHDEPVRLDLLLDSVLDDLRAAAHEKQISVNKQDIQSWIVPGDSVRLRRVFMNLLGNALQYTPNGGHLWIDGSATQDQVTIVIRDDGPGIPEEDLPYIFDRFYRVDQARNHQLGGTGLGLAISKAIVEAHGGRIVMESTFGQGTRVHVTLPKGNAARFLDHH